MFFIKPYSTKWYNINDTGFRIRRYYGELPTTNVTTIQNSDRSSLYFTQPIDINISPTTNMDLEVLGNISTTTTFTKNLSRINASFDTIWARNMLVIVQYIIYPVQQLM